MIIPQALPHGMTPQAMRAAAQRRRPIGKRLHPPLREMFAYWKSFAALTAVS